MTKVGVFDPERQHAPLFRDCDECELFVQYVLSDEAIRPPARITKHQKRPLEGIHIGYQVRCRFRGSDRSERIFVCITAFTSMGFTLKSALVRVAELLKNELGKSRRGRPSGSPRTEELMNKAGTVRSIFNSRSKRTAPIKMNLWDLWTFRNWRAWALVSDEETLKFLTDKFVRERGVQATTKWRAAVEAVRRKYSGYKDAIEKRWADVLQRFAIPAEAEQALRDPQLNPTWVEAALEAMMMGDGAIAAFRDEDFLRANGVWASLLMSKWIEENPSEAKRAGLDPVHHGGNHGEATQKISVKLSIPPQDEMLVSQYV